MGLFVCLFVVLFVCFWGWFDCLFVSLRRRVGMSLGFVCLFVCCLVGWFGVCLIVWLIGFDLFDCLFD